MPVTVRLAGPEDVSLVLSAHEDVFDAPPVPHLTEAFLKAPHLHLAIAVDDGQTIGMCSGVVYHHPDKAPQWWINELGVAAPWRRQGIATRLVGVCSTKAKALGCTEIWVIADPTDMAEGFYQSLGWARTGQRLAMFTGALTE